MVIRALGEDEYTLKTIRAAERGDLLAQLELASMHQRCENFRSAGTWLLRIMMAENVEPQLWEKVRSSARRCCKPSDGFYFNDLQEIDERILRICSFERLLFLERELNFYYLAIADGTSPEHSLGLYRELIAIEKKKKDEARKDKEMKKELYKEIISNSTSEGQVLELLDEMRSDSEKKKYLDFDMQTFANSRISELRVSRGLCGHCGSDLSSLDASKCSKCHVPPKKNIMTKIVLFPLLLLGAAIILPFYLVFLLIEKAKYRLLFRQK